MVEAHGLLFAGLSRERAWVKRTRGFDGEELERYLRTNAVTDLFALREASARLEFELELSESDRPGEMGERWSELLGEATGVRFEVRAYLERLGQRFGVARYLRGRMLAAQLLRELRERFDHDWYRNPLSGPFLADWLAHGMRFNAPELAATLGNDRLGADALIAQVRESLP